MRVIVFSDSHGQLDNAFKALKEAGRLDYLLHAGDLYLDAFTLAAASSLPVKAVLGNCDKTVVGPAEELFELGGHRFFITHGHLAGINRLGWLMRKARTYRAEVVIYGHTHSSQSTMIDGILLLNPGSISRPRDQERPSYAVIEIGTEGIKSSIHHL